MNKDNSAKELSLFVPNFSYLIRFIIHNIIAQRIMQYKYTMYYIFIFMWKSIDERVYMIIIQKAIKN